MLRAWLHWTTAMKIRVLKPQAPTLNKLQVPGILVMEMEGISGKGQHPLSTGVERPVPSPQGADRAGPVGLLT